MIKLVLLSLFLPIINTAFCQYPAIHYEKITDQQGLNDLNIKCLLQDSRGFIWIGGENGLYRYDGYNFVYYKDPPGCKNCPHFYPVYDVVEDNKGWIWTISFKGITVYDPAKKRSFAAYRFKSASASGSSFSLSKYLDLMKDSRGNIWATSDRGLIRFSCKRNSKEMSFDKGPESNLHIDFFPLNQDTISSQNLAYKIYEDSEGNIWTGCADGLYVLRKGGTSFVRLKIEAEKKTKFRTPIEDILQQNKDTFWISPRGEDCLYLMTNVNKALQGSVPDGSALCFRKFVALKNQPTRTLYKDRKNNIFIGTRTDVIKFKGSNEKGSFTFESIYNKMLDKNDYTEGSKYINCILEDRSGMLWIGQIYSGIMKFNPDRSPFLSYNNLARSTFTNLDITTIRLDIKGNLWIGVWGGGLYRIQKETNQVTRYDFGKYGNDINCIEEINSGAFWIGTNEGVMEFSTSTGKSRDPLPVGKTAENLRAAFVSGILKDHNQLYFTTGSGIFVYDVIKGRLAQFSYPKKDNVPFNNNWTISPIKLINGEILAASSIHGILKINYDAEKSTLSVICLISDSALRSKNINLTARFRLYQDNRGSLWMVEKTGLHRIDLEKREIYDYKLFKNIEFPEAWSIIEDNRDNLWIGTNFGLCRFNINTSQSKHFSKDDGVPISIHQYNCVGKDKDGRLFFGGNGGFYSFHPDSIKTNTEIPPVVITDFKLYRKSVIVDTTKKSILTKDISCTTLIELRHDQNDLAFEFAALDYTMSLKNQYAYKLEGYQDEWIQTDAGNRLATYTNLDPGSYTFRVKGSNSDGVWNEKGTSLNIIIHKPWWESSLAWCIYVLIFLGAFGGYIQWRFWRLKKEKLELERQVKLRTRQIEEQKEEIISQKDLLEQRNQQITEHEQIKSRFFTNVSHEFRTPLSLIQSPVEELLEDPHRSEKERWKLNMVRRNARRLLDLANQLLDISKIDGSKMKLELVWDDVMKHLRAIAGAFTSLAETKRINYQCHFPMEETISWFDPDKLEKIAGNLLSNAFKFTPAGGTILMTAQYTKNDKEKMPLTLHFSVKDSGTGIPANSLEKIFDRFYQVEESIKNEGGGTGIGLSLAQDMVRLMHGDITVESEEGKGSMFSVQFPLGKDHLHESEFIILKTVPESIFFRPVNNQETEKGITAKNKKSGDGKPVLLIVEDNRDIRMQLSDSLQPRYNVWEAIDGIAGLKKAVEAIPDLIITDLMMPRMDGIEFCEKVKNDERTSHIPVIMLTAKVTLEDKISGLHSGADDYIQKPFNIAELKARISNLIEQRKKLRVRFGREITLEPREITITRLDEKFLNRAIEIIEKHMHNDLFDLPKFREEMNMSGSTLFRKLHALTGQSPTEFIRTIRLKKSARLLKQNFGNVTQASLEVGFNNLSYFNKSFKKLFGISPVEYMKKNRIEVEAKEIMS